MYYISFYLSYYFTWYYLKFFQIPFFEYKNLFARTILHTTEEKLNLSFNYPFVQVKLKLQYILLV